jgi:SAM-dependent methyltransferase
MVYLIIYFIVLVIELIFAFCLAMFAFSLFVSSFMGSPYVPTKTSELKNFLKDAHIKKGSLFLDLGCGDGRVVRAAVTEYGARGIGVDINYMLILWARIVSFAKQVKNLTFKTENIMKTDVSEADYIYLFLMPALIAKLEPKLKKETKKGALILSHGFPVKGWEKYNYKTIEHKPFPTYYYQLHRKR